MLPCFQLLQNAAGHMDQKLQPHFPFADKPETTSCLQMYTYSFNEPAGIKYTTQTLRLGVSQGRSGNISAQMEYV